MQAIFDWMNIYLPTSQIEVFIPALFLMGLTVGIISSFFGIGGAWLVTPGLNILGFPMTYAIGTDIAHMAGKSVFATYHHAKMKNVDYKLGAIMIIGTIIGIECGAQVIMQLEKQLVVESVVRWSYIWLLSLIDCLVIYDYLKARRSAKGKEKVGQGVTWHKKLQKLRIKPMIYFPKSNLTCTLWLPVLASLITGFLAGFLGIGGGLFRMPALIYLVGCTTVIAVGTDLFEVMISGLYGAISYSMKGRVDFMAAFIMLCGAIIGAKIGATATRYVSGYGIRLGFAFAIVGCLISLILKQMHLASFASWMIFSTVGFLATYITYQMVEGRIAVKRKAKLTTLSE